MSSVAYNPTSLTSLMQRSVDTSAAAADDDDEVKQGSPTSLSPVREVEKEVDDIDKVDGFKSPSRVKAGGGAISASASNTPTNAKIRDSKDIFSNNRSSSNSNGGIVQSLHHSNDLRSSFSPLAHSTSMSANSSPQAKRALMSHISDSDTDVLLSATNVDNYKVAFVDIFSWKQKKESSNSFIKKDSYAVYIVHVTSRSGLRWSIEKRYQQFRDLRKAVIEAYPDLVDVPFPSKKWLFNMSESNLRSRQIKLRDYMQSLLQNEPDLCPAELLNGFLEVNTSIAALFDSRRSMSLSSIQSSLSVHDFKLVKVIGKGSFGKVYLVRPLTSTVLLESNADVFAMKVLKKSEVVKRHQVDHTNAERWIMEKIRHPFLLSLRYAFQTQQKLYMITDYCAGGEVFFHLKRMQRFNETVTRFYIAQMALAVSHLHEHNIIYRDLKPENILLDRAGYCKLTDFGLSKIITESTDPCRNTFCGTPEYLAPEVIVHRQNSAGYGKEIDWWALGIVCFELLTGWPPFYDRDFSLMCEKILSRPINFPSKYRISLEAQSLIKNLLMRSPTKRLCCGRLPDSPNRGIESLQSHAFFRQFDWDSLMNLSMPPPYVPTIGKDLEDTRNFDKEFTKLGIKESPPDRQNVGGLLFDRFSFSGGGGGGGGDAAGGAPYDFSDTSGGVGGGGER